MTILAKFTSPDSGRTYEVREGKDGVLYCTCAAWVFSKKKLGYNDCKHLKQIREALASGDTSIFTQMNQPA